MKLAQTLTLALAAGSIPALADGPAPAASTPGSLAPAGSFDLMNDLPGPDRPPAGRSLFDFMTTGTDGTQTVAFPIETLVDSLRQRSGSEPRVTMIPKGRSLQRDHADFTAPRVIIGFDGGVLDGQNLGHQHLAVTNQLFLGFSEKANQIEVISFNKAAGRFEFQIVHDYKDGGNIKVTYASRALCTKCHHSGSPTFGPPPWSETNAIGVTNSETKISDLIAQNMNGADNYHGFKIKVEKDVPYGISDAATDANGLMAYQKMWTHGCGKDDAQAVRCRGYALQFALEMQAGMPAGGTNPQAMAAFQQMQTQYWQSNFGTGLSVPTHTLVAYNPLVDTGNANNACDPNATGAGPTGPAPGSGPSDGFPDLQPGLTPDQMTQITGVLQNSSVPRSKDPLCHVEPPLKLKTIDHCGLCVVFGVRAFLYDSDRSWIKQATGSSAQKLVAAIDAMVAENSPALANRAFRRNVALAAVAAKLGVAGPNDTAFDADSPHMQQMALDSDTGSSQEGDTPLAVMKVYCAPCHVQLPGRKGFLKGASDAEVTAKIKGDKDEIITRLSWGLPDFAANQEDPDHPFMPLQGDPKRAALEAKPADHQKILDWVKTL